MGLTERIENMRDTKIFDEAVMAFFEPIARRLALPLLKVRDGVYEIPSPHFIMRDRSKGSCRYYFVDRRDAPAKTTTRCEI
jgi:hypothetical protein